MQPSLPPLRPEKLWHGSHGLRQGLYSSAAIIDHRCQLSSLRHAAHLAALRSASAGQQRCLSGDTGKHSVQRCSALQRRQPWQHTDRQRLAFSGRPAAAADGEASGTAEQRRESKPAQQSLAERLANAAVPSTLSVDSSLDVSIDSSLDGGGVIGDGHDSHDGSGANGSSAKPIDSLARRRNSLQRQLSAAVQQGHSENKESGSHTLGSRISQTLRGAFQTYYTVVFYNTVIRLLRAIGADTFASWAAPRLEIAYALLAGSWHVFKDGRRRPFSLANNYDPDFSIPPAYHARDFPFGRVDLTEPVQFQPRIAHLLSLAMKIVYEHNDVIEDIVSRSWGLECLAIIETQSMAASQPDGSVDGSSDSSEDSGQQRLDTVPGSEGRKQTEHDIKQGRKAAPEHDQKRSGEASFLPSSKGIVLRSPGGMIIAFRGTEAFNLLNWRTNFTINMTRHRRLGGVHDGFYSALFHRPAAGGSSLFEDVVDILRDAAQDVEDGQGQSQQPVYITGHSLGGALASLFAAALAIQEPDLAARVAAVYTWGEPRVGDSKFRDVFNAAYGDRCFRIRNAGDIVPFLLPQWLGYRHRGRELFLTSFNGMVTEEDGIRRAALLENLGFPVLYLYKIVAGRLWRRESWLRTLYRISFLLGFPGFTEHFPSNYEIKMRAALEEARTK